MISETAATATVAFFWFEGIGDPSRRARIEPTRPGGPGRVLSAEEWATLDAALRRLLPSAEGSPGAAEVNAIGYLDAVLDDPGVEPDTRALVRERLPRVDEHARSAGGERFSALDPTAQDAVLRRMETQDADLRWLRVVIAFALEALLGDPIHGGNTDEIGWKWAGHVPPTPRPPAGWRRDLDGPR